MCVQKIVTTSDSTSIFIAGVEHKVTHVTDLQSWPGGSKSKQADAVKELLQLSMDVKQAWTSLSADDPDKGSDPDQINIFWGDNLGAKKTTLVPLQDTFLVSRPCVITNSVWNGTVFELSISIP